MIIDIPQSRLSHQQLTIHHFSSPEKVVGWFGAIQAQDFAAAKWALALRTRHQTNATIEEAFNQGKILRTHIMRPTWHFVTPEDIRWILALTSPRVHKFNGSYYRKSGLDKKIFQKSNDILQQTLEGGKQLTRIELASALEKQHIPIQDLGLTFTLMQAELDGIICSGPRKGKQFTYMLLDERAPKTRDITEEEALIELATRYFQSHGPAQMQDMVWWSGLTTVDIKKGIELLGKKIQKFEKEGKTYWTIGTSAVNVHPQSVFLVPGFDEYFIAYKDRNDTLDPKYVKTFNSGGGMVKGAVVVDGTLRGIWNRRLSNKRAEITVRLLEKFEYHHMAALEKQIKDYEQFIELPTIYRISHT